MVKYPVSAYQQIEVTIVAYDLVLYMGVCLRPFAATFI